jgi:hypothetical protein
VSIAGKRSTRTGVSRDKTGTRRVIM